MMPEATAIASRVRTDLERLVRIPSVSLDASRPEPLRAAARATGEILAAAGLPDVELIDVPGAPPVVFGAVAAPPGAPTVLLYAHYDVQPAGPRDEWTSDPFEPVVRDGRLYGRGTADDKCGVAMHAALLRAFAGRPPVGVKVVVEGDEDSGRSSFGAVLRAHAACLAADVVVIADGTNRRTGEPTLCSSVRGGAILDVEVRALHAPVHNGVFGGPVPDALMALTRMLAGLHADDGSVAVPGLRRGGWEGVPVDDAWVRAGAGVLDGVRLIGTGSNAARLYAAPAINAIALDAPAVETATNALVPAARARLCARLAPDEDPLAAADAIADHLARTAPWGIEVEVRTLQTASGMRLPLDGTVGELAQHALTDAYGTPAVAMGMGGSNPLLGALADALPAAQVVLWGPGDDRSRIHSADESVDLADLACAADAQIRFVRALAAHADAFPFRHPSKEPA